MLNIDNLRAFGANVDEGLGRCFNNESFYLKLVKMSLADPNFERLNKAVASADAREVFEACHALKGAMGNLSLKPIYEPVCALTEQMRGASEMGDISALYGQITDAVAALKQMVE